jgi:TonB family protein
VNAFCLGYSRYNLDLPLGSRVFAYKHFADAGLTPETLGPALLKSSALREATYKSLYYYCAEVKFMYRQSTEEIMFAYLAQTLHLSTGDATTLVRYSKQHYQQEVAKSQAAAEAAEQQDEPSPSEEATPRQVATYVEQMPSLPGGGGMKAIVTAIQRNLRYPAEDKQNKTEGRVLAAFTVDEGGQAGNVKIIQGLSATINAEAVRAIEALPKFTPGKQNGRAVAVSFTVPLNFRLPISTSLPTTP